LTWKTSVKPGVQNIEAIPKIHELFQDCKLQMGDMNQVHSEDPQRLGGKVQNLAARVNWRTGFVYPSSKTTKALAHSVF
jgi:hypothetical protein